MWNKKLFEKEQVSYDNGSSWSDTGNVRLGSGVVQSYSTECECYGGEDTRWVVVPNEYYCVGTNKYTMEQMQTSEDCGEHWTPTASYRPGSTLIEANSTDCGYIAPQYRWWVVPNDYLCYNDTKYQKLVHQVSYDGGNTWQNTDPYEETTGNVIEVDSPDCGYVTPQYRWAVVPNDYMCYHDSKYEKTVEQVSYNSGVTWQNVIPEQYSIGSLIEADSQDCIYGEKYFTTIRLSSGSFTVEINRDVSTSVLQSISYSLNGTTWVTTNNINGQKVTITTPTVNAGQKVYWKGIATAYADYNNNLAYTKFNGGRFIAEGNIMSLLYGDNFINQRTLSVNGTFYQLFAVSGIVDASNLILPATTLAGGCYYRMFYGNSGLTAVPELPATTLANGCYRDMFRDCENLTTAPALPATTLASGCYDSMFESCTSLTTAPELPATTLAEGCYFSMFAQCTSLTTAPVLSATTLEERCYQGMFNNCSSLNYVKCLATDISASQCADDWLRNVSSTGTFVKNPIMTSWPRYNWIVYPQGIPSGWSIVDAT